MIPATSITFNDDDTAWWVVPSPEHVFRLDRPCDVCGGLLSFVDSFRNEGSFAEWHCNECIDGRHTFDLEVECCASKMKCNDQTKPHCAWGDGMDADGIRTHRVSVIEGMVVPIVGGDLKGVDRPVIHTYPSEYGQWFYLYAPHGPDDRHITHFLPPDAAPDKWAVKLTVAT